MSIDICKWCSRYVDTDYDVSGYTVVDEYGNELNLWFYFCHGCQEDIPDGMIAELIKECSVAPYGRLHTCTNVMEPWCDWDMFKSKMKKYGLRV